MSVYVKPAECFRPFLAVANKVEQFSCGMERTECTAMGCRRHVGGGWGGVDVEAACGAKGACQQSLTGRGGEEPRCGAVEGCSAQQALTHGRITSRYWVHTHQGPGKQGMPWRFCAFSDTSVAAEAIMPV